MWGLFGEGISYFLSFLLCLHIYSLVLGCVCVCLPHRQKKYVIPVYVGWASFSFRFSAWPGDGGHKHMQRGLNVELRESRHVLPVFSLLAFSQGGSISNPAKGSFGGQKGMCPYRILSNINTHSQTLSFGFSDVVRQIFVTDKFFFPMHFGSLRKEKSEIEERSRN